MISEKTDNKYQMRNMMVTVEEKGEAEMETMRRIRDLKKKDVDKYDNMVTMERR